MKISVLSAIAAAAVTLLSCSQVAVTGRNQLSLVSSSEMLTMSTQQYADFLKTNKVIPADDKNSLLVKRVGQKIQQGGERLVHARGKGRRVYGNPSGHEG